MKESDLNQIWQQNQRSATDHYQKIAPEMENLMHSKPSGVLYKIFRNLKYEIILTIAMLILILLVTTPDDMLFWIIVVGGGMALAFYIKMYLNLRKAIREVNQHNLLASLIEYIQILSQYIKRLKIYTYFFTPLGYFLGASAVLLENINEKTQAEIIRDGITFLIVSIPVLIGLIYFTNKKYVKWLYGRHLEELRNIKEQLSK
ncbi:MAG: hypothetical protein ACNS62_13820 [Candidatus Cyclobacteriaceae bacterium M3_2C_046]